MRRGHISHKHDLSTSLTATAQLIPRHSTTNTKVTIETELHLVILKHDLSTSLTAAAQRIPRHSTTNTKVSSAWSSTIETELRLAKISHVNTALDSSNILLNASLRRRMRCTALREQTHCRRSCGT